MSTVAPRSAPAIGCLLALSSWFFGIGFALLCHYVDYGWNPGARTWAKYALVIETVAAALAALYLLGALVRLEIRRTDTESSGGMEAGRANGNLNL